MYSRGMIVKKDQQEAILWYQKSAEQDYPKAQFNLGVMSLRGDGIDKKLS